MVSGTRVGDRLETMGFSGASDGGSRVRRLLGVQAAQAAPVRCGPASGPGLDRAVGRRRELLAELNHRASAVDRLQHLVDQVADPAGHRRRHLADRRRRRRRVRYRPQPPPGDALRRRAGFRFVVGKCPQHDRFLDRGDAPWLTQ